MTSMPQSPLLTMPTISACITVNHQSAFRRVSARGTRPQSHPLPACHASRNCVCSGARIGQVLENTMLARCQETLLGAHRYRKREPPGTGRCQVPAPAAAAQDINVFATTRGLYCRKPYALCYPHALRSQICKPHGSEICVWYTNRCTTRASTRPRRGGGSVPL